MRLASSDDMIRALPQAGRITAASCRRIPRAIASGCRAWCGRVWSERPRAHVFLFWKNPPRASTAGCGAVIAKDQVSLRCDLLLAATACTTTKPSAGTEPGATVAPTAPTATPSTTQLPASQPTTEEPSVPTVRITVAEQTITAQLANNPTAQDLTDQLPLTLTFRDFNRVEKVAELPRPLTMDGVPAGDDPDIGDIGYYAPSSSLVFYYGDVGYWNGIVRIGRFADRDIELIKPQPDGFQVTIERA